MRIQYFTKQMKNNVFKFMRIDHHKNFFLDTVQFKATH